MSASAPVRKKKKKKKKKKKEKPHDKAKKKKKKKEGGGGGDILQKRVSSLRGCEHGPTKKQTPDTPARYNRATTFTYSQ